MKKLLFTLATIFVSSLVMGQTTATENYVKSTTYKVETTTGNVTSDDKIESVTYFDGLGRPKQSVSIRAGGSKLNSNLLNWRDYWTISTGSAPSFNANGATLESQRILGTDPYGNQSILWECINDAASDGDGGWNTDYISIDNTIEYRYTVWVKRTGSKDGHTYHGPQNVNNLSGSANSNPYFWTGDPPNLNEWYLLVGVIHPYTYSGGNSGISGVYDTNGNKVLSGNDFKWSSTSTTSRFRSYLYYATDTNVRQYFYNPIVEQINGNENSINELIEDYIGEDIITHSEYDEYGRQVKDYLPYATTTTGGAYQTAALNATNAHYLQAKYINDIDPNSPNPFSEKELELSPLSRVLKQAAPGNAWKLGGGHEIKFENQFNETDEVKLYKVFFTDPLNTESPSLIEDGFYSVNELYKTVTKDENHSSGLDHTTEEFKNKQGQVILKRTYDSDVKHDTYYVYDDFGNLTYVLPPKMEASTTSISTINSQLNELGYQYKYDSRNRLVEKRIPGKGLEYIVYNLLDKPVMTQDANLKAQDKWLFTKYDVFGRVAFTGVHNSSNSRVQMQKYANNQMVNIYTQFVSKTSEQTLAGTNIYYTNSAFPYGIYEIHTINYYDNYTFDGFTAMPSIIDGQTVINHDNSSSTKKLTKGLATGSKVRVLGTNHWITTITGYDEKGRAIYMKNDNPYLDTEDIIKNTLNFTTGVVNKSVSIHDRNGNSINTEDLFTYDHMGRLIKQSQIINGDSANEETIVENNYDDLGQLITKGVGGKTSSVNRLQTIDYTYNIRGWLKDINDTAVLGEDLFAFKINYNSNIHGGADLFNGNISETEWKTANIDNSLKWYTYDYDALNRITSGLDNTTDQRYSLQSINYDKNGNILNLVRKGSVNNEATLFDTMDNLSYTYQANSNKLVKVSDDENHTFGFKDDFTGSGIDPSDDYTYDANGNMLTDANKNITAITYNHLNLPTQITTDGSGGGNIHYIYDATGVKLAKSSNVMYSGSYNSTIYAGNYIYKELSSVAFGGATSNSSELKFMNHPEGYIEPDGNGNYDYIYQYKDHLGNIRLSYKQKLAEQISNMFNNATTEGWAEYAATVTNYNDQLKVQVSDALYGAYKTISVTAGEQIQIDLILDKATTDKVSLYEFSVGKISDLVQGSNYISYTPTVSGDFHLLFVKDSASSDVGSSTYFYVDNIDIKIGEDSNEILEENNYYPFGLKHKGYNNNPTSSNIALKKTYNGKEFQDELGLNWHDYGARNYDASLGRWMNIDNASEEYYDFTPYSYVANSPLIATDPTGERIVIIGDDEYRSSVFKHLLQLASTEAGFEYLQNTINSDNTLVIQKGNGENEVYYGGSNEDGTTTSYLDFDAENATGTHRDGSSKTPENVLAHEFDHFLNERGDRRWPILTGRTTPDGYDESFSGSEASAVEGGNKVRATYGEQLRKTYGGINVYDKEPSKTKYGKLSPKAKKFNPNDYKGKFSDYPSVIDYLSGTKRYSVPPSKYSNKRTHKKYSDIDKTKANVIEKKKS